MKNLLIAVLAVVSAIAIFLALMAPRKSSVEKLALENRITELEAQLLDTQKKALEVVDTRPPRRAPMDATRISTPSPSKLTEAENARLEKLNAQRMLLVAAGLYSEAMTKLNLDRPTTEKALLLLAERYQVQTDTGNAAYKAGITDSAQITKLAVQELAKVDKEIRDTLGADLYDALEDEVRISGQKRMLDLGFGRQLFLAGKKLTPEQSDALAKAVWQVKKSQANDTDSTAAEKEAAEFAAVAKVLPDDLATMYQHYTQDVAELQQLNERSRGR